MKTKSKPKIAFLVSDTDIGGIKTSVSLLLKNIDRSKFHVVVIACGSGPIVPSIANYADEYYNLETGNYPQLRRIKNGKLQEDFIARFRLIKWLTTSIWKLSRLLRKEKIELIHTNSLQFSLIAGVAGRLAKVPSVWHIRAPKNMAWRRGGPFFVEGYLASWLATIFIANSYFTASGFHKSWKKKTVVIWNAIDVEDIITNQRHGRLREIANVPENKKLVGLIGLIEHRKGIDRFVEMAAKLSKKRKNVRFVVIGGDVVQQKISQEVKADLIKLAEKLGVSERLCFTGNIDNASYYLGDMDTFFMCSRPGTETFGLVVIEAMAAGVPVVAFDNDAMSEIIIDNETGYLVPEGDIDLATERISSILDNNILANDMKEAGSDRVRTDFDIPVLINNIQKLYWRV